MADILDQIAEVVSNLSLAKSRRTNSLSDKEKAELLSGLEEVIKPLLEEAEQPQVPSNNGTTTEPQWVGISKADDLEITADKKSDILDAWVEEFNLDKDRILSTKVGFKYFYVYPTDQGTHELWIEKKAA